MSSSPTTLSFTRSLNASPAAIWRCWTEPDLLRQWFAPKPATTRRIIIEPKPGGRFFFEMQIPDHGPASGEGCVLIAEHGKRLIWTNSLTAGFTPQPLGTGPTDFAMTAEILIAPEIEPEIDTPRAGTRYSASVFHATPEDAQKHRAMGFFEGWGAATGQLEELAASL